MSPSKDQVLLGARIPKSLKKELDAFCDAKGFKMNFFIGQAIKEKLDSLHQQEKGPDPKLLLPKVRKFIMDSAKKNGITKIRVFGSVARGESKPGSDLDLLVDMEKGKSLFDLAGFDVDLNEHLPFKVDVVVEGGINPHMKDYIYKDAVPL